VFLFIGCVAIKEGLHAWYAPSGMVPCVTVNKSISIAIENIAFFEKVAPAAGPARKVARKAASFLSHNMNRKGTKIDN
jgi:hypothetical protein